jgi:adenosylcobinamide-phosphate synthase
MGLAAPLAVLVALFIDHRWGEPPARWHPVVWMGQALAWTGQHIAPLVPTQPPCVTHVPEKNDGPSAWTSGEEAPPDWGAFALGAGAWLMWGAGFTGVAGVVQWGWLWAVSEVGANMGDVVPELRHGAQALLVGVGLGLLLKPMLAWRMLCDEVAAVEVALQTSLAAGRERLSWLVSREVSALTEAQVRESAIETLAENLNDSVVAPLFWFAVAGLPGAVLYRWANTADAMWGYRGTRGGRVWTWAGKWAARADDVLSWLPARLTAALLWAGVSWGRWRRLAMEAAKTPSPNGGWCMGAMALALGVRLGKPGVYVLNAAAQAPVAADTWKALKYAKKLRLSLVFTALLAIFSGLFI